MTISYAGEVPNGSSFGCFWRILCKWRGSVYKLVWRELLAYLTLYYTINFIYRFALTEPQQRVFEKVRQYFGAQSESIPMSFVLGFYVSLIVKRWWEQYKLLPWPDTLALFISAGIPGADETGRLMRRNIVRYAILAYVITLQRVSLRVKRRFPTWQHVVDSGLMLESERKVFEKMDGKSPMSKYWMPLVWATNIINRARKEGLITSDHIVQTLLVELSDIRRRLGALIGYDTVCVPLVYTQVVTLALYTYFVAALMGRQLVPPAPGSTSKYEPDVYFPLFTALQFCFYVGWLKVAEVLINPFGEDDDDIELNWLIDRHIKAAYMIVDEMHEEHPELLKDQYWEEVVPKDLPYTVASEHYRRHEPACSADHYKVKAEDAVYANVQAPRKSHDETYADYESVDTPLVERRKNWFQRQISRMGSVRSASTAYSSGGLFGRNRHNSVVYSSPEAGQPPPPPQHKMSLYERLVGRKSGRHQHRQNSRHGNQKNNGSAITITAMRNRPRIPTPDVTKEVMDRERGLAMGMQNMGVIMAQSYQNEVPVLGALVLSPIQELDSGSVHNTLHAGQPGTTALAQAVLSGPLALTPMTLMSSPPPSPRLERATPTLARATVTELPTSDLGTHSGTETPPDLTRQHSAPKRDHQRSISSNQSGADHEKKFTRGEKCLFTHLVVTFIVILVLAIIFIAHLIWVNHTNDGVLRFTRRNCGGQSSDIKVRHLPLGYVYLATNPMTSTCNALLLRSRWSVAPAHCVAMRSDPDMAQLLNAWRIKYRVRDAYIESEIKRSIPHPHFNRDDFSNNIGVFEHVDEIDIPHYVYPETFAFNDNDNKWRLNSDNIEMVSWGKDWAANNGAPHELRSYSMSAVEFHKCQRFVSPIVDIREYETCLILKNNEEVFLEHGAILLMDLNIIGFFSWGERSGKGLPFVVVNILHFKEWLNSMISLSYF